MTVPPLVLMLATMVTAMAVSLQDHAAHAAAVDIAELRAEHAASAFVAGCITHQGCVAPQADDITACAAADIGVVMTAQVSWDPKLWKRLTPAVAERIVAYDTGFSEQFRARATTALPPC